MCEVHSVVALGTPGIDLLACGPQPLIGGSAVQGVLEQERLSPSSKVDAWWASGVTGFLHEYCICIDNPGGLSFSWRVSRVRLCSLGEGG